MTTVWGRVPPDAKNPRKYQFAPNGGLLLFIWLFTLLLLCGLGAFSYVQFNNIRAQQLAGIHNSLSTLTRVNEAHALRTLQAADQTMRFMMAQYADKAGKLDFKALAEKVAIDSSLFTQIGIIDAHGILQLSNVPFKKGQDLSGRDYFKVHLAADTGDLFVSQPVPGPVSGKWSLQLTRRINLPDGGFGGVAVVSIDAGYFSHFYAELDLPPNSAAALTGLDGVIRARQLDGKESFGDVIFHSPLFKFLRAGKVNGSYTVGSAVDGVERIYAYRKISGYPLVAVIGIANSSVLAMFASSRHALIVQAAALCLLLLAAASALTFHTLRLQAELAKRHRIATDLRTSGQRLELALMGGELGVWDWNLREKIVTSNNQFSRLLGYQAGELRFRGNSFVSLVHLKDLEAFRVNLRRHLKGQTESLKDEFRLRHKRGNWIWISLRSKVIERDTQGRAVRLSGTAHDVTSRANSTLALLERDARWSAAIGASNQGIWDWDVSTQQMHVCARLMEIMGFSTHEPGATMQDWVSRIHPDDREPAHQQLLLLHFKMQSDFYRVALRLQGGDGRYRWMLMRGCALYDKAGKAVRVTGSAFEITDPRDDQEISVALLFPATGPQAPLTKWGQS